MGFLRKGDGQVPHSPADYGDPVTDQVLADLVPVLERQTGIKLYPTYSYFRVYKKGDLLKPHRDRPACEISLSVNMGQRPATAWPLWIEGASGIHAVKLKPGDGLLYYGVECMHWREKFAGSHLVQVFFHFVDRTGPYREWKFDKRKKLSTTVL